MFLLKFNNFVLQLWKDGKKQGELIGSHKAYLVVDEVRQMIENECTVWAVVCQAFIWPLISTRW